MLLHQHQLHRLQAVEVVHARSGVRHPRDAAQGEERLPREVVGRQHVVVHDGEGHHGAGRPALLQRHAELEALVEDGVQRPLVHVGLLLVAVGEHPVGQQLDDDEGVAEAVRVQGDDVARVQDLRI